MRPTQGRTIYVLALLLGAAIVATMFPLWALTGGLPAGAPPSADFATHVVGQRYFFATPWHWPVLIVPQLMAPWGVNIAFTDSNPLAAMFAKLLRPALPHFDQVVTIWQAICWLLQPASAVFALRSAGERRLLPNGAVAIMASVQPAFLFGFWHSSLTAHFVLFGMIGLYFRIVRGSRRALAAACAALPLVLLVHPYLVVMEAGLFGAAPLTLLLRRHRSWRRVALALCLSCGMVAVVAMLFGYTAGRSPGGYNTFSLNLIAPVFPVHSALIHGFTGDDIDATGRQIANDGYLGVGFILLLAILATTCSAACRTAVSRHPGLALACLALWLVALSNKVTLGKIVLFRLHTVLGPLEMIRASSRLFWPVSYVLLIGAVGLLAARKPRLSLLALPLAALLQCLDAPVLLAQIYTDLHVPQPWLFDPAALRRAAAASRHLVVIPPFGCKSASNMLLMQPLWIGSETLIETNTAYVARIEHRQSCDLANYLENPPAPGDLLVMQPGYRENVMSRPWAARLCETLSDYTVCSDDAALRDAPGSPPAVK